MGNICNFFIRISNSYVFKRNKDTRSYLFNFKFITNILFIIQNWLSIWQFVILQFSRPALCGNIAILPMVVMAFYLNALLYFASIYISFTNTFHTGNILMFLRMNWNREGRKFYTREHSSGWWRLYYGGLVLTAVWFWQLGFCFETIEYEHTFFSKE